MAKPKGGGKPSSNRRAAPKAAPKPKKPGRRRPTMALLPSEVGPGHNSGELTEAQKTKLLLGHVAEIEKGRAKIEDLTKKRKSAVGEVRALFKTAKADGFSEDDINYAIKLRSEPDEALEEAKRRHELARWLAHPIGTQFSLFGEEDVSTTDKAFDEGKVAGLAAEPRKPPYHPASPEAQRWLDGYHAGQQVNISKAGTGNGKAQGPDEGEEDLRPGFLRDRGDPLSDAPE